MSKAILINARDHARVPQDEYDDWYETEHLPQRMGVPGFRAFRRWRAGKGGTVSIAVYELDGLDALQRPEYLATGYENVSPWTRRIVRLSERVLRFEGTQILPGDAPNDPDAGAMLLYATNVEAAFEPEFNDWYDREHVPNIRAVPGVLAARRFKASKTSGQVYVALYDLVSTAVLGGEDFKRAVETPWTERVRPHTSDVLMLACRPWTRPGPAA